MSAFVAAALLVGIASLAYVFAPILRTRAVAGGVLITLSLITVAGLYAAVGTPDALDPARRQTPLTLDDAIVQLERELAREPAQAEGWRLLADAYRAKGRTRDAADALARAVVHQPKDPELLAQAAEARAVAAPDRRFDAEAVAILQRALAMDPTHQRALWFLGVAQRQSGRAADAARTWESLLARVDAATATALRAQVQAARADAGLPPLAEPAPTANAIEVSVDIAPALRDRLPPGTTVFVLARTPGGPPMPVAVERLTIADLPARVRLDDADAAMPTRRLSQVDRVDVLVRASASGSANAGAGDLESRPVSAKPGDSVSLRIDRVRP